MNAAGEGGRALRAAARVALVAAGVLAASLLLEGACRWSYKAPWYERLIAEQARNQAFHYRRNHWGLRDSDFAVPKPAGEKRVLVLGDSFSFGIGVRDERAVFPDLLEQRLNELRPFAAADHIDVLNGGIPGSMTADWVRLWEKIGDAYDPDVVLIVYFLRDGTPFASIPEFFGQIRREVTERNRASFLYDHCYAYRVLRDRFDQRHLVEEYSKEFRESYFGTEEQTAEWRRAQSNMLRIRDLARKRGAVVGLVVFPVLTDLEPGSPFASISDLVESFGSTHAMATKSLLPAFRGRSPAALWVSPYDQHPNERGHAIAAAHLLPFAEDLLKSAEWFQQAAVLERAQQWAAAASAYDGAFADDPWYADAEMHSALIHQYRLGDAAGAVERYDAVLRLEPAHYGAHYQVATALLAAGRIDEARARWLDFEKLARAAGDRRSLDEAPAALRNPGDGSSSETAGENGGA